MNTAATLPDAPTASECMRGAYQLLHRMIIQDCWIAWTQRITKGHVHSRVYKELFSVIVNAIQSSVPYASISTFTTIMTPNNRWISYGHISTINQLFARLVCLLVVVPWSNSTHVNFLLLRNRGTLDAHMNHIVLPLLRYC
jgi:hypothetical protein